MGRDYHYYTALRMARIGMVHRIFIRLKLKGRKT